jgi:hypothetical protein
VVFTHGNQHLMLCEHLSHLERACSFYLFIYYIFFVKRAAYARRTDTLATSNVPKYITYLHTHTHTHIYTYIYTYILLYICLYVCMLAEHLSHLKRVSKLYTCVCVCICYINIQYKYMCVCVCVCVSMQMHG